MAGSWESFGIVTAATVQYGDLATWVAALGTTGTFIAGLFVLRAQRRELGLARLDRAERDEDRRREQARHVSAWCIDTAQRNPAFRPSQSPECTHVVKVRYRNGSDEPIYGVQVVVKEHGGLNYDIAWQNVDVIPPHRTGDTTVLISLPDFGDDLHMPDPPVEIAFTDSAGRDWKRTDRGKLIEPPEGDRPPITIWARIDR